MSARDIIVISCRRIGIEANGVWQPSIENKFNRYIDRYSHGLPVLERRLELPISYSLYRLLVEVLAQKPTDLYVVCFSVRSDNKRENAVSLKFIVLGAF